MSRSYTLQNHLLYISLAELDTPIYLITSQLKILTTALSSVVICQKVLVSQQWICLCVLALGVMMVQFEPIEATTGDRRRLFIPRPNHLKGIVALVLSSLASALAGSWFERSLQLKRSTLQKPRPLTAPGRTSDDDEDKDLKGRTKKSGSDILPPNEPRRDATKEPNLWAKNLQLSVPSLAISYLMIYLEPHSRRHTRAHGFFHGFLPSADPHPSHSFSFGQLGVVWLIVIYHSLGGLLVSIIVKQSGSLVKNFATCFSIVLSVLVSSYSNQTRLGFNFYLGSLLVLISIKTFTSFSY